MLLEVGHHPTTEAVPGIESLLLHQEVHQLRQTLVVPDPEHKMKETVNFLAKLNVVSLSPKNWKFFPSELGEKKEKAMLKKRKKCKKSGTLTKIQIFTLY